MYCGILDWTSSNYQLTVKNLILRHEELKFDFETPWEGAANIYTVEGVAGLEDSGCYSSPLLACKNRAHVSSGITTKILLELEKIGKKKIYVKGTWYELIEGKLTDQGSFSGWLGKRVNVEMPPPNPPFPDRPPEPLTRTEGTLSRK